MSDLQHTEIKHEEHSKAALVLFCVLEGLFDSTFPCTPATFLKLVENMPNVNYVFPATKCIKQLDEGFLVGNTLLHVVEKIKLVSIEYFNVLLDQGADFTIKNNKGNTVIHEVIENDLKENFIAITSDDYKRLQHAGSVLSAHIRREISTNPCNKNGLTHFHVACMVNHVSAVKFFLKRGASINEIVKENSPTLPGFTALHFAANYFAVDVVKVLLEHDNININAKDIQGMSPLYLLVKKKLRICVVLMAMKETKSTLFFKNLRIKCEEIDQMIMLIAKKETTNLIESLHALCTMQDTSMIEEFLNSRGTNQLNYQLESDMHVWPGYSALHFAAHFSVNVVRLLVKRGAQLELKDAKGVTPFEICLQNFKHQEIVSILECHPNWLSIKTNLLSFIKGTKLLSNNSNMAIHVDSPFCADYTLLHFLVALTGRSKDYWDVEDDYFMPSQNFKSKDFKKYLEKIKSCLQFTSDVATKNASGSTPLHLAFQLQESHAVYFLLKNHTKIVNPVDANNLSHLHIACAAKDEVLVKKLLLVEPDINRIVKSKYKWCNVKSDLPPYGRRYPVFIIAKGSTALHFAAVVCCPQVAKLLIENGADVFVKDCDGLNPLERVLKRDYSYKNEDEIELIKLLVQQQAKLVVEKADGPNQILCCYKVFQEKRRVFNYILGSHNAVQNHIFECARITPLHSACQLKNLDHVRQLLENGVDVNAQVSANCPLWPGYTPLHVSIDNVDQYEDIANIENDGAIVKLLLEHGADITIACADHQTPLHMISSGYLHRPDLDVTPHFINLLLPYQKDFTVNPVNFDGLSHFHVACFVNNIESVEKFIENGVDVNQATDFFYDEYGGYSSLHFAAHFLCNQVLDLLLARGADVHWKAIGEDNALHSIAPTSRTSCRDIIKNLIRIGVDVNAKNAWGETPLERLLTYRRVRRKEIDLYFKQNCRVNYCNPIKKGRLLALALKHDSKEKNIFDDIIKAPDITITNEDGHNAIHNVVSFVPPEFWKFETLNEIDEDLIPEDNYISAIKKLVRLGLDIDQQNQQGSTPLHVAAQMQNGNGIIGLLCNGSDINLIDSENKTAYAYSLNFALRKRDDTIQKDYDLYILAVFMQHIAKLNLLNLEASKFNNNVDLKARSVCTVNYNTTLEECRAELEKSKNHQIGSSSVTVYDFTSETGAVSVYPNMFQVNRQIIDKFFESNLDMLQSEFPNLAGLIILQYRKAVARVDLIEPAMNSLNFLVQFKIPHLCTDMILKFLTNKDLDNLIAAAVE